MAAAAAQVHAAVAWQPVSGPILTATVVTAVREGQRGIRVGRAATTTTVTTKAELQRQRGG
eukprot:10048322-Alexandrium_andersonii.AAC.1